MKKLLISSAVVLAMACGLASCGSATGDSTAEAHDAFADTVSYVEGMNYALLVQDMIDRYEAEKGDTIDKEELLRGMAAVLCDSANSSYSAGIEAGLLMKRQFTLVERARVNINYDQVFKGLREMLLADSVTAEQDSMVRTQRRQLSERMRVMVSENEIADLRRKQSDAQDLYTANVKLGRAYVDSLKRDDAELQTTPSGLVYKVLEKGEGRTVGEMAKENVAVVITGRLIDGTVLADSKGHATQMRVDQYVPGFTEGLQLMSKGERCVFYIPAHLGYGMQSQANVPVGSMLIFDVTLTDIVD